MGEFQGTGKPRIFQIGFNRCGTTSIHRFFEENGLRSIHWARGSIAAGIEAARIEGKPLLHYVDGFQVYCDMEFMREDHAGQHLSKRPFKKLYQNIGMTRIDKPIYAYRYFRELYHQYPGSRFILNTRDIEDWIKSRRGFLDIGYKFCSHGDSFHDSQIELENCWREHWNDHIASVRSFFSNKPEALLEYHIENNSPQEIVEFLDECRLDSSKWGWHNSSKEGVNIKISEIEWPEYSGE
jgi:hypothetical protein